MWPEDQKHFSLLIVVKKNVGFEHVILQLKVQCSGDLAKQHGVFKAVNKA